MEDIPKDQNLDDFIEVVDGKQSQCMVCEKTFATFWGAKRHVVAVHAAIGRKVCPGAGCKRSFRSHNQLRSHAIQAHGERKLSCPNVDCPLTSSDINV